MMSRIINRNTGRIITQHLLKGGCVGLLARPTLHHLSLSSTSSHISSVTTTSPSYDINISRRFYTMPPSQSSAKRDTVWFDVEVPKYTSLGKREIETDVCVIGGGIAGVTSAYLLAKEGKKVTLIEARGIGSGETGRTSAHLMSAIDDRFFAIGQLHGKEAAKIVAESHKEAIDLIERISTEENIKCDFKRVEGFLIPHDKKDGVSIVKKEADYADDVFGGVKLVASAPMGGYFTGPCALFPNQGQFHPMKYLVGVVKAFEKLGGVIYTGDIVTDALSGSSDSPLVKTDKGGKIKCKDVVIATCHPSFAGLPTLLKEEPYRTYMIAGRVPKGSVPNVLIWNTADPYIYARISPCDDKYDYLLVGGEDHPVGHMTDPKDPKQPIRKLEQWAKQHYPMLLEEKLAYEWSGEVWEPIDMVGIIGRDPKSPDHVFMISGDSGTGLTHSSLGAKLTTDLIMGRANKWEKVYAPGRIPPLGSIKEFARYGLHTSEAFAARIAPSAVSQEEVKDVDKIAPGSGAIMTNKAGKKVAVYRPISGPVQVSTAVCPHMGALLTWNDYEKSWDCPAHGSRFSTSGDLLNGPSTSPLPKADL